MLQIIASKFLSSCFVVASTSFSQKKHHQLRKKKSQSWKPRKPNAKTDLQNRFATGWFSQGLYTSKNFLESNKMMEAPSTHGLGCWFGAFGGWFLADALKNQRIFKKNGRKSTKGQGQQNLSTSTNGLGCWFGAFGGVGFGSRIPIPFIFGDSRNPNHQTPQTKN